MIGVFCLNYQLSGVRPYQKADMAFIVISVLLSSS
jgi:hypothetical protein